VNIYPFIEAEKAGKRNVARACALLKVSRAAFYQHLAGRSGASAPTRSWPSRSRLSTRSPRAAMAPRGFTLSWPAAATGTGVSASPG
jgi:hypothetical protein